MQKQVMALALYIVSLAASAGLAGAYVRQTLGSLGYLRDFDMEILAACSAACVYAALQLAYMAVVRLFKPTTSVGPYLTEVLSQLSALLLIPYILTMTVPWPHPALAKAEPLTYLGLFLVPHVFFKLATFYAAIRGERGMRLLSLAWLLIAGLFALSASWFGERWLQDLRRARPWAPEESRYCRIGDSCATAYEAPEGVIMPYEIRGGESATLTLRFANPIKSDASPEFLDRIYVTVTFETTRPMTQTWPLALSPTQWAELRVPAGRLAPGAHRCSIVWDAEKPPAWQRLIRLRPFPTSQRRMLLSGPFEHEAREKAVDPNIVVVMIEGLSSRQMSAFGYSRTVTPFMDRLAAEAQTYPNTYSPAPETAAAAMTLFTGVSPLRHQHLGSQKGPLPHDCPTLAELLQQRRYVTVAFTEGESPDEKDLVYGTGFERGFELFDPSFPDEKPASSDVSTPPPSGSAATIAKLKGWLDAHAEEKFFAFVRLSELRDPQWLPRYQPGFVKPGATPAPIDVYDSALAYVDRLVGDLIKHIRSSESAGQTCIVVTSPYGLDFSRGMASLPVVGLTENCLRVPFILYTPSKKDALQRSMVIGLADASPSLLRLAQTTFPSKIDGEDLAQNVRSREPVSMSGNPLTLSMRSERWRFSWRSTFRPFESNEITREGDVELLNVDAINKRGYAANDAASFPDLVARYRAFLTVYLQQRIAPPPAP